MKHISVWMLVMCLFVVGGLLIWVDDSVLNVTTSHERMTLFAGLLAACMVMLFLDNLGVLAVRKLGPLNFIAKLPTPMLTKGLSANRKPSTRDNLGKYLRFHHGPLWRRKTRLYLVIGEPEQIQAIAPHLSQDHWLHGEHNVLLWGGSVQAPLTPSVTELCQQLTRWRALDGVIWALTPAQSKEQQIL
ncbi:hypothetical protein CQZ98_28655, partial [Pseudomonas sp. MYb115]